MEIIQYVLNFFFPGDNISWWWNYLFLVLLIIIWKSTNNHDNRITIK